LKHTAAARKRPVNLTLDTALIERARAHTSNLSATIESLLADFVARKESAERLRRQSADRCADDWNVLHDRLGSIADEHSTL